MSIAAVILNYNDAAASIEAVERIINFKLLQNIIIVDNCSTDDSATVLESYVRDKGAFDEAVCSRLFFIKSEKNGGYGYGNNLGVRYARERLGAKYAVIANPDSVFEEALLEDMLYVFEHEQRAAVAGAVMAEQATAPQYEEFISSAWPLRGYWSYLAFSGPVLKRLFAGSINYKRSYFEEGRAAAGRGAHAYLQADAVHGSLLMVSTACFEECGGYDEQVFLYCEEDILASRMKDHGYESFCCVERGYSHEGSHSITGSGSNAVRRQRFRQASELHYCREYLKLKGIRLLVFRGLQKAVLLETRLMSALGLMR